MFFFTLQEARPMKMIALATVPVLAFAAGAWVHDALVARGEARALDDVLVAWVEPEKAVDRLVASGFGLVFHPEKTGYWSGSYRYRGAFTCMMPDDRADINMDGAQSDDMRRRVIRAADEICALAQERLLAAQDIPAGDPDLVRGTRQEDFAVAVVEARGGDACRAVNGGMFFLPAQGQTLSGFEAGMPACKAWAQRDQPVADTLPFMEL